MTVPEFEVAVDRELDALTCIIPFAEGQVDALNENDEILEKYLDRVAAKFRLDVRRAIKKRRS